MSIVRKYRISLVPDRLRAGCVLGEEYNIDPGAWDVLCTRLERLRRVWVVLTSALYGP